MTMLMGSFADSERILSILRSSKEQHLAQFFNYIYVLAEQVGKVVFNRQGTAVMLLFTQNNLKHNARSIRALIGFLLFGISWMRIMQTVRNNRQVKMVRRYHAKKMGDEDYIYVWFLAGKEEGNYKGLLEIVEILQEESCRLGLPVYIETAVQRMIPIYKRAGFRCYNERPVGEQIIWFGKMEGHAT